MLIGMKYMHKSLFSSKMLNPTVTLIINCINDHLTEPLSLKTLSGYTFLNQSYLAQIFHTYMKIGVMDYVNKKDFHCRIYDTKRRHISHRSEQKARLPRLFRFLSPL